VRLTVTTIITVTTNFRYFDYLKLFQPPNMPKSFKINDSCLLKACEAAQAQKKPNISKIAREYGVPYSTLYDRVKHGAQP
jgi:transcriptional regulator of acetoin/glycerol metabolism